MCQQNRRNTSSMTPLIFSDFLVDLGVLLSREFRRADAAASSGVV